MRRTYLLMVTVMITVTMTLPYSMDVRCKNCCCPIVVTLQRGSTGPIGPTGIIGYNDYTSQYSVSGTQFSTGPTGRVIQVNGVYAANGDITYDPTSGLFSVQSDGFYHISYVVTGRATAHNFGFSVALMLNNAAYIPGTFATAQTQVDTATGGTDYQVLNDFIQEFHAGNVFSLVFLTSTGANLVTSSVDVIYPKDQTVLIPAATVVIKKIANL